MSLFGDAVDVRFLPYDTPAAVARFLDRIRPRLAVIMETELWPNLFHECERRGVPLVLASARLSAKSVARYRRRLPVGGATQVGGSPDRCLIGAGPGAESDNRPSNR
jgi:3-deoxy-D-manno-octulosonic-acid transferase